MSQAAANLWTAWTGRRDQRAFEALVCPELPHAMGYARRLGCNVVEAEDALQDALARLAIVRDDTPPKVGLRAWLCREVRVRARSRLRSERRRRSRQVAASIREACDPAASRIVVYEEVERALRELGAEEREAVTLRYLHDLDYRDLALVLGLSEGACRQRVHRGLERLRARFGLSAPALVAALPLPPFPGTGAFVKAALSSSGSIFLGAVGGLLMASVGQKVMLATVLVAAAGMGGVLLWPTEPVARVATPEAESAALGRQSADGRGDATETPGAPTGPRLEGAKADSEPRPPTAQAPPAADRTPLDPTEITRRGDAWRLAILQASDPEKRTAAWNEVRAALAGVDRAAVAAALWTIAFTSHVTLDRSGLGEAMRSATDAAEPQVRLQAWAALVMTRRAAIAADRAPDAEPIDLDRLRQQVADSPLETRAAMLYHLILAGDYVVDGRTEDLLLRLLDSPAGRAETIRGLGTASALSDAVVAKVLEYARSSPEATQQVQRQILQKLAPKSWEVVTYLLDAAEVDSPHALEGLATGVLPEDATRAGERLRRLFDARSDPILRGRVVTTIGRMGDESSRDWLVQLRDDKSNEGAHLSFSATVALRHLDGGGAKSPGAKSPARR